MFFLNVFSLKVFFLLIKLFWCWNICSHENGPFYNNLPLPPSQGAINSDANEGLNFYGRLSRNCKIGTKLIGLEPQGLRISLVMLLLATGRLTLKKVGDAEDEEIEDEDGGLFWQGSHNPFLLLELGRPQ